MKERKRRNELKIWKLIRIKIQYLPTDTVAQWVERRRDKPRTWVQIQASVIFLICAVAFFLSLLPWWSLGRSNFDWGLQKLNNVDPNNDIQIWKITILKLESTVDIHRKILYIYIYIYDTAVLINICRFWINVVKLCKPLSKLDLPMLRKGST